MTAANQKLNENKEMRRAAKKRSVWFKKNIGGWLLMLPSLVLFSFFIWVPLIRTAPLAFAQTNVFKITGFAGFDNFRTVFADAEFVSAVKNTFLYAGYSVLIGFLIPIVLGMLLNEIIHFKGILRVSLYFPSIVSGVAVAMMWQYLFDPTPTGFFNVILNSLGFKGFNFLSNRLAAIPLIVVTMTWRGAGATVLIYLSSLQTVDNQLYEAARIDGAGILKRVRYVTIPHIAGMVRMLFILQIISVFQVFYEPLIMTAGGGPDGASMSLLLKSYRYAFDSSTQVGLSAATSLITAVIIIVFTVFYLYVSKPRENSKRKNAV